jgi:hypothetical protein
MQLNGTHQLLVYADDVKILGVNINTIKKNTAMFEAGQEVNTKKVTCLVTSRHQNAEQNDKVLIANKYFENVAVTN